MTNEPTTIIKGDGRSLWQMRQDLRKMMQYEKPGPKLKQERADQIIEDFESGISVIEISRAYGISRQRVYQILKQLKGECIVCSNPAAPNRVRCLMHIERHAQQQAAGGSDA
jgi:AraC-like DNA-binding protein